MTLSWPSLHEGQGRKTGSKPIIWQDRLFSLAAYPLTVDGATIELCGLHFWKRFGELFITTLCRLPEGADFSKNITIVPDAQLDDLLAEAPPIAGGEYLNRQSLSELWRKLALWCIDEVAQHDNLSDFLQKRAPNWRQVGQVTFHLAENKTDIAFPFAFMATYTIGLNNSGQPVHKVLGDALKQYAREADKLALISLLSPVRMAASNLSWVNELVENGSIYRPLPLTATKAYRFLQDIPQLETSGLIVRIPDWWRKRPLARVSVTVGSSASAVLGQDALLDWDVGVAIGDEALSDDDIRELLSGGDGLMLFKGQWIEVDKDKLQQALTHWQTVREQLSDGLTFAQGMRLLSGLPLDLKENDDEEDINHPVDWPHTRAGDGLAKLLDKMRAKEDDSAPAALHATLRPYQQAGLAWLKLLSGLGMGACLADDMGLGKTIQILALLLHDKEVNRRKHPSFLVVPASLLGNWKNEAEQFAPSLQVHIFHPAMTSKEKLDQWEQQPGNLQKTDLVVTSYAMLTRKADFFSGLRWRFVIADEAQAIKNSGTRQSRAVKKLISDACIALTGTPIENRLSDLWSLFDFINPGLLGSGKTFKKMIASLEKRDTDNYGPLRRLVSPYILRRMKTDTSIINDLPDKTETVAYCHLTKDQARLYASIVNDMSQALDKLASENDRMRRRGLVLQSITRLKQVCNHPDQLTGGLDWKPERSGKFIRLSEICQELAERQKRILVFTQFKEIISPLSDHLEKVFQQPGLVLHGETGIAKRKGLVDAFQAEDGPPFFILSLKAGGTGLNLTAAGHVIHFDRWWNPAVEDQATDRAFRIGQKKNVLVHKCVTRGTLEERIHGLLEEKRQLAGKILQQNDAIDITAMDNRTLLDLVRLDLNQVLQ